MKVVNFCSVLVEGTEVFRGSRSQCDFVYLAIMRTFEICSVDSVPSVVIAFQPNF